MANKKRFYILFSAYIKNPSYICPRYCNSSSSNLSEKKVCSISMYEFLLHVFSKKNGPIIPKYEMGRNGMGRSSEFGIFSAPASY